MTSPAPAPNPVQLNDFNISAPVFVAQTPYADVWKVTRTDGSFAALKIYKRDMDNEGTGFDMLRHWNGIGAAQLYGRTDTAALIEWLDGPSLGDIVRGGDDDGPTRALVAVANILHTSAPRPDVPLDTLDDWFADLFAATCTPDCPQSTKATLHRAKSIAGELLQDPAPQRCLGPQPTARCRSHGPIMACLGQIRRKTSDLSTRSLPAAIPSAKAQHRQRATRACLAYTS